MKKIVKIVINIQPWEDSVDGVERKITITKESIQCEYEPSCESETNMAQNWSYKTNSPLFQKKFDNLSALMLEVMSMNEFIRDPYVDKTIYVITYADNSVERRCLSIGGDETLENVSSIIGQMKKICQKG